MMNMNSFFHLASPIISYILAAVIVLLPVVITGVGMLVVQCLWFPDYYPLVELIRGSMTMAYFIAVFGE